MPYIKQERRKKLDEVISPILCKFNMAREFKPGDLAYVLTQITKEFIYDQGLSYTSMSSALGVLGTVKHEIERRMLDPYEDKKKEENGDVF